MTESLSRCGPYEPGTCSLVAVADGTEFSYQRANAPATRLPVPGERVRMRWTTSDNETPCGEGLVVSVVQEERGGIPRFGPTILVLWSVEPDRMPFNPIDDDDDGCGSVSEC